MTMKGALKEAFEYVRMEFFPRWDRKKQWKIKVTPFMVTDGLYNAKKKVIVLKKVPSDRSELYGLLIHEICHCVGFGHGKRWLNRMRKATERTQELGNRKFSDLLFKDMKRYESQQADGAKEIYQRLCEWVIDTKGDVPYETIVTKLASEYGISRMRLEEDYKRLRYHYDGTRKEIINMILARNEMMEKYSL